MGNALPSMYVGDSKPDHIPLTRSAPTFPPDYGFPEPRKERVSKVSEEEMIALQLHPRDRDYCAHTLKDMIMCRNHYAPFFIVCKPEYHAYEHCQYEDMILRMKEFEREKRLRMRELRKQGKSIS